jgi:hypothetical protein
MPRTPAILILFRIFLDIDDLQVPLVVYHKVFADTRILFASSQTVNQELSPVFSFPSAAPRAGFARGGKTSPVDTLTFSLSSNCEL